MNTVIEMSDLLFAVFTVMCTMFAVLGYLSYLEYTRHYRKARMKTYYAYEHHKFANIYRGDACVYGFLALLTGLLAILMVL